MRIEELDTPSLLFDRAVMKRNIDAMQAYADRHGVALRPHTKTHKCPELARLQLAAGARGVTVAKVGEAEVMAQAGITDIFIANEIASESKLARIAALCAQGCTVSFGMDGAEQAEMAERVFARTGQTARVLAEIEVGENRSGFIEEADFLRWLSVLEDCSHLRLCGVFSHDGSSYSAPTREAACEGSVLAQWRTLRFARIAREKGFPCETVSVGSTPSQANGADIVPGVTEIRPGTYILMDASQAHAVGGDLSVCAATVLAAVISRPTAERVVLDVGAKGLTMQTRTAGICATAGLGTLPDFLGVHIGEMFDEHAMVYDRAFREAVRVGQKVRIIPVHICPVCNLYDSAYLVEGDEVVGEVCIAGRGRLR